MPIDTERLNPGMPLQYVVPSPAMATATNIKVTACVDDRALTRLQSRVVVDTLAVRVTVNVDALGPGISSYNAARPSLTATTRECVTEADFRFQKNPAVRRDLPSVLSFSQYVLSDESTEAGFALHNLRQAILVIALGLKKLGLGLPTGDYVHQSILSVIVYLDISVKSGEPFKDRDWLPLIPMKEARKISRVSNVDYHVWPKRDDHLTKPFKTFVTDFGVRVGITNDEKSARRFTGDLTDLDRLGLYTTDPTLFESLYEALGFELFLLQAT